MKKYESFTKKQLKEAVSFLDIYKQGDQEVLSLINEFIQKFNAPRTEICKGLSELFGHLANQAEQVQKEKNKRR